MKNKFNLMHLCMIVSISGFAFITDMESVLEVGRDNQLLSAKSQDNIDEQRERQTKLSMNGKLSQNKLKA